MLTIILDILEYLNLLDIQSYIYSHKTIQREKNYYQTKKKIWVDTYFEPVVQQLFPQSLLTYPLIRFKEDFLDQINYIRYIYPKDVTNYISLSYDDKNQRPFIIITYQETITLPIYKLRNTQTKILTLFRHLNGNWSVTSPYEGSLFSKDPFRKYLVYDHNELGLTYIRLQKLYQGEYISISDNNFEYQYSIKKKESVKT